MNNIKIKFIENNQNLLFKINDSFFESIGNKEEFYNADIDVNVNLELHNNIYKMSISIEGEVDLVCDISNTPFRKKICNKVDFFIKFGKLSLEQDYDIIILEKNSNLMILDNYIYETVFFSIPLKKEHPKLSDEKERAKYDGLILNNRE